MASWDDVRRIALHLPETDEGTTHGNRSWRVKEKAPVITAWLAMTAATVASTTMGISAQLG